MLQPHDGAPCLHAAYDRSPHPRSPLSPITLRARCPARLKAARVTCAARQFAR